MVNNLSLSEYLSEIQCFINETFSEGAWVRAEIAELHENSGHCYLELIEKDENSDSVLAKIRATIWSSAYCILKPYFEAETGQTLSAGLSVLLLVNVNFHSVYGISLNIKDIEPKFTVGEIALRRQKIIQRLESEGVADMNKLLEFPQRPQRIAAISSATAAGYGDFMHQLQNNEQGFVFYTALFQSVMQGEGSAASIISALERIYENINRFDAIVIIRGGGATADLASFDNYELALNCAQFPLPILAGIGHQRDLSIVDIVAHESLKTPTAVAEFLIDKMQNAENELFNLAENISDTVLKKIEIKRIYLENAKWKISQRLKSSIEKQKFEIQTKRLRLENAAKNQILHRTNRLNFLEKTLLANSPLNILKKGYTITTLNGRKISPAKELSPGDKITSIFYDGKVESEVKK